MTEFRTAYGPTERVQITCGGNGRTHQSMADECDINRIMARFEKDGVLTHVAKFDGKYGDFTGAMDYHSAYNQVILAGEMFMSLPASIRDVFDNDPGMFLAFAEDPDNEDEMREMGLLPPAAPEEAATEPETAPSTPAASKQKEASSDGLGTEPGNEH